MHELEQNESSLSASLKDSQLSLALARHEVDTFRAKAEEQSAFAADLQLKLDMAYKHLKDLEARHHEERDTRESSHVQTVADMQVSHEEEREASRKKCQDLQEYFFQEQAKLLALIQQTCSGNGIPDPGTVIIECHEHPGDLLVVQGEQAQLQAEITRMKADERISQAGFKAISDKFEEWEACSRKYYEDLEVQRREISELREEKEKMSARVNQLEAWFQSQHSAWTIAHEGGKLPSFINCAGHDHVQWKQAEQIVCTSSHKMMCNVLIEEHDHEHPALKEDIDEEVLKAIPDAPQEMLSVVQNVGTMSVQQRHDFLELLKTSHWFPKPQCGGWWEEFKKPDACQVCSKMVNSFSDGAQCSNGGHWICWKPCLFTSVEWDKFQEKELQEVLDIVNRSQ